MAKEKVTGNQMAEMLTDFINSSTSMDREEFVATMMREHRTLQEDTFLLMLQTVKGWANKPNFDVDGRNAYTVQASRAIVKGLNL